MQRLDRESNIPDARADCALQLLELTPVLMRRIRHEMRSRTMEGLSVPQFRTLSYISRHPTASLGDVASHLGLTPPSASKLVQKLVVQKVVKRRAAQDRRRVCLSLTDLGSDALARARLETQQQFADNLKSLSEPDLSVISSALGKLAMAFGEKSDNANLH